MILALAESGLEFVAADFPHANRFTIHVLAAVAEYESKLASERVKQAHAEARRRGVKLGQYRGNAVRRVPLTAWSHSIQARQKRSQARAMDLAPIIWRLKSEGKTVGEIMTELDAKGIRTAKGGPWYPTAVARIVRATSSAFGSTADGVAASVGSRKLAVARNDREVGSLLVELRAAGMTLKQSASELHRRGVRPLRAPVWSEHAIRNYLLRALGVASLPPLRRISQ